jgi:hypothetical protein
MAASCCVGAPTATLIVSLMAAWRTWVRRAMACDASCTFCQPLAWLLHKCDTTFVLMCMRVCAAPAGVYNYSLGQEQISQLYSAVPVRDATPANEVKCNQRPVHVDCDQRQGHEYAQRSGSLLPRAGCERDTQR